MKDRTLVKHIIQRKDTSSDVTVAGWVRSIRQSKNFSFLILNDGSCQQNLQIIMDEDLPDYTLASSLRIGACVKISGTLRPSQGKGQTVEMQAKGVTLVGSVDESYPLQKKSTKLEFLRDNAHLRPRTNLFSAIFRIRHRLAMATHTFFDQRDFYYLNTPIITGIDAEGAGEMFKVTAYDLENTTSKIDPERDYFGIPASLCVSGQLEAECFALGMNAVYTFGPTFRAENSNTPRHLAEFWMVEPEMAFVTLEEVAQLATDYLKCLINTALNDCPEEMEAVAAYHRFSGKKGDHLQFLNSIGESSFETLTYTEALQLCKKSDKKFEFGTEWGIELQTEHERYLAEEICHGPVIVTDYPRDTKAFYMKQNDDEKTVQAMDVLVPGVGEIIGGSQREECPGKLQQRMQEMGIPRDDLWWYLDLRKFGSAPHGGFGLGFERAVRFITDMQNVRDVIPFPRTPRNCRF